jgi:hypothetical protein
MEVKIIKENQIENKVYFEIIPDNIEYQNQFIFGKELEISINDNEAMQSARALLILEAGKEFDNQINIINGL